MGILSGIGRFLFGGPATSKTTGTTNSTTTQAPYAPVAPALDKYIGQAENVFTNTPQISGLEQQGYDALQSTAAAPATTGAAIAENNKTLSGEYLTPETNPYLADIAKRVGGDAMASINATFGGHGRTGSGLHQEFAGRGVGSALTDFFGQNYEAERGRMSAAVGQAPGLDASRYLAPQALISAGQNVSARPFDIAQAYGGVLGNIARLGGTTTAAGTTTGSSVGHAESAGLVPSTISNITNSFTNKLFK